MSHLLPLPRPAGNGTATAASPHSVEERERPTLLLADDEAAVLEGVRRLVESEFRVVATVSDGQALLAAADRCKPDVILADISMPLLNGFEAARRLKAATPSARIIFLTVHEERTVVTEALELGVNGYVVKRSAAQDLLPAIREVLAGRCFVSPAVPL